MNGYICNIFRIIFIVRLISNESQLSQNSFHYREIHSFIHSCAFRKICDPFLIDWFSHLLSIWIFQILSRKVINIVLRIVLCEFCIVFYERYFIVILRNDLMLMIDFIIQRQRLIINIIFNFIMILIRSIFSLTALINTE